MTYFTSAPLYCGSRDSSDVIGCCRPTSGVFICMLQTRVTLTAFPIATPRGCSSKFPRKGTQTSLQLRVTDARSARSLVTSNQNKSLVHTIIEIHRNTLKMIRYMINSRNESQIPKALNTFFPQKHSFYSPYSFILFSHLADAFIQSDLQMRATEAIN